MDFWQTPINKNIICKNFFARQPLSLKPYRQLAIINKQLLNNFCKKFGLYIVNSWNNIWIPFLYLVLKPKKEEKRAKKNCFKCQKPNIFDLPLSSLNTGFSIYFLLGLHCRRVFVTFINRRIILHQLAFDEVLISKKWYKTFYPWDFDRKQSHPSLKNNLRTIKLFFLPLKDLNF